MEVMIGCYTALVEPEIAEAMGLKEALCWVKMECWLAVVVETDCQGLNQAIRSSTTMMSPFGFQ